MARRNSSSSSSANSSANRHRDASPNSGTAAAAQRSAGSAGGARPSSPDRTGRAGRAASGGKRSGGSRRAAAKRGSSAAARPAAKAGASSAGTRGRRARAQAAAEPAALRTIRENPIPSLMIGVGLTWLLLNNRTARSIESNLLSRGRAAMGELGETSSDRYRDAAGATRQTVGEGLTTIAGYARSGAGSVGEAMRSGVGALGSGAQRGYDAARDAAVSTWRNYPLAVCAAALAAGVTAGMMLPATRAEVRVLGKSAGSLVRRVRDRSSELLEQGKQLASDTAGAVGRAARREGLTPRQLRRKVKRVASDARDAVVED